MTRSIMTPIEYADMTNRMMTTILANVPICDQRERGSHCGPAPSCNNHNDQTCNCKSIVLFSLLRVELNLVELNLLAQREVHIDDRYHFHWLSVEESLFIQPLSHGLQRRRHQQRMAA